MKEIEYSYTVDALVHAGFEKVFAFLSSPESLGNWSLGCFDASMDESRGVCVGHSLFSGVTTEVRIKPDKERGKISFFLEHDGAWSPRIAIELKDGQELGYGDGTTLIAMSAWRTGWMGEYDWERLKKCHDVEILMIKEQLERKT